VQSVSGWCEDRGLAPAAIRAHDVATYIEELQAAVQAPSVKQQLAAISVVFNWLVTGQVVPTNPAAAVRVPKHIVKTGKTLVLEADAWRKLLKSIPTETLRDLRHRALIATLTYSFACITAALKGPSRDAGQRHSTKVAERGPFPLGRCIKIRQSPAKGTSISLLKGAVAVKASLLRPEGSCRSS
jgi:site-specific recombinase XerC